MTFVSMLAFVKQKGGETAVGKAMMGVSSRSQDDELTPRGSLAIRFDLRLPMDVR
jgi:hypothetical protein